MKTPVFSILAMLIALALFACGGGTPTPSAEKAMVEIYTSVAMTFNVQSNFITTQSTTSLAPVFSSSTAYPTASQTAIPTITISSYSIVSSCNGSVFISDVTIPDGTILAPGEIFTKKWEFINSGTCPWTENFSLAHVNGNAMSGGTTTINHYIFPGNTAIAFVDLIAPDTEGTYTGCWQLADDAGIFFGEPVYVEIVVSGDAATSTPAPTTRYTSTPTTEDRSTPTLISIPAGTPTDTPIPVEESSTPTLTNTPEESANDSTSPNDISLMEPTGQ